MDFDVQSAGLPMTDELAEHTRRRLRFVLMRHRLFGSLRRLTGPSVSDKSMFTRKNHEMPCLP